MKKVLTLIIFQLLFLQITAENQIRDQFDILLQNNTNNIRSNKLDTSYKMFSFSNYKLFSALENNNRIDLDNNSIGLNFENYKLKLHLLNINTNKMLIGDEYIKIDDQQGVLFDNEFQFSPFNPELKVKYRVILGENNLKIENNKFNGFLKSIVFMNNNLEISDEKGSFISYKNMSLDSYMYLNAVNKIGKFKVTGEALLIGNETIFGYLGRIEADFGYSIDEESVKLMGVFNKFYARTNPKILFYGVVLKKEFNLDKLTVSLENNFGTLEGRDLELKFNNVLRESSFFIFDAKDVKNSYTYNLKLRNSFYNVLNIGCKYKINDNMEIFAGKTIPVITGIEIERDDYDENGSKNTTENSGTNESMDITQIILSGLSFGIQCKF